jgi:hypothetical protein
MLVTPIRWRCWGSDSRCITSRLSNSDCSASGKTLFRASVILLVEKGVVMATRWICMPYWVQWVRSIIGITMLTGMVMDMKQVYPPVLRTCAHPPCPNFFDTLKSVRRSCLMRCMHMIGVNAE